MRVSRYVWIGVAAFLLGTPSRLPAQVITNPAGKYVCYGASGQVTITSTPCPTGTGETFGSKLRRLAGSAALNNPSSNTPMAAAPAWAASTAYVQGQMVTNQGYQYICSVGGTSAASGGPTGQAMGPITDNTVTWFYYGISISASAVSQPVISQSASIPGGLTNSYAYNASPSPWSLTGGNPVVTGSSQYQLRSITTGTVATSPNGSNGYEVTFMTDATKIACTTTSSQQSDRYIVDGQYVTISAYLNGTGVTPSYNVIDFTNAGARRTRQITMEINHNNQFGGCSVAPTEKIWAPSNRDNVRVIWVGDSITAAGNSTPAFDAGMIPRQVGYALGWSDVWNDGIGGTGFVATNSGASYSYPQRITYDVTPWSPNLVVVQGSINDVGQAGIQAAALSVLQTIRSNLPSVPIVVLGIVPDSANNGGSTNITTAETSIQAAVTQFGDSNTYFVPINNDASGAWITGTGKVTATNGTGNADAYISSDGVHPTDQGRLYLARRIAVAISNVIQQIP